MRHLSSSCPLKARRYYKGKTRANAVLVKRRGPYHTKRSLNAVTKRKGGEEARDRAEAICLDPPWIRKSREQARALQCEAKKKENARLKHKEEKDGDCGSVQEGEFQKEARRQYGLKRYANPAVREKARTRYREATKAKARPKGTEESDHDDPPFRLGRPIEAKRQQNANKTPRDSVIPQRWKDGRREKDFVMSSLSQKLEISRMMKRNTTTKDNENDDSETPSRGSPSENRELTLATSWIGLKRLTWGLLKLSSVFIVGSRSFYKAARVAHPDER